MASLRIVPDLGGAVPVNRWRPAAEVSILSPGLTMTRLMFLAILAALWVTAAVVPGARAQGVVPDVAVETGGGKERARELAGQGQALYDEGRYLEAAAVFERAQATFSHFANLYNIAKAYEKAADYQKAAVAYRGYLDLHLSMTGELPGDADDVERTIVVMKDKAYMALPEVRIDSDPPGADVAIDEASRILGQTPMTMHLPEGPYTVYVRKQGFQPFSKGFEIRSREPLRMTFALEKIRNDGTIQVSANIRKARIYVDGKVVAVTPYDEPLVVEAGSHQIMVEKEDYSQFQRFVEVGTDQIVDVHADLYLTRKGFSWRGGVGITSILLGGGALGTGFWMRSLAGKEFNDSSKYQTYKTWAYVGYGVGAGLAALGTGLLIWEFTRSAVRSEDRISSGDRSVLPTLVGGTDGQMVWVGAAGTF